MFLVFNLSREHLAQSCSMHMHMECSEYGKTFKNVPSNKCKRMQPKAQRPSMRCHKHWRINFVAWHSREHVKWQLQMTKGVRRNCTSLRHLCHKWKWIDGMIDQLGHLVDMYAYSIDMVALPRDRLANFVGKLSHSPCILLFAHWHNIFACFISSLAHLTTSTHTHTPTIYK